MMLGNKNFNKTKPITKRKVQAHGHLSPHFQKKKQHSAIFSLSESRIKKQDRVYMAIDRIGSIGI